MDFQSFFDRTGMSQSDLARTLGVSSAAVKKWREGGNMDLKYIDKLLQMGMRIEELFSPEAWVAIKNDRLQDFNDPGELSPEECRKIIIAGIERLEEQGEELLVLRKLKLAKT